MVVVGWVVGIPSDCKHQHPINMAVVVGDGDGGGGMGGGHTIGLQAPNQHAIRMVPKTSMGGDGCGAAWRRGRREKWFKFKPKSRIPATIVPAVVNRRKPKGNVFWP